MQRALALTIATVSAALLAAGGTGFVSTRGPVGSPSSGERAALDSLEDFVRRRAAADSFSGVVLVARAGRVLLERSYGLADRNAGSAVSPRTRFNIASVTKAFTGVAVLQLAQAGRLSLDDTVGRYLPGLPPSVSGRVTVRHLLTHTSGMGSYWKAEYLDANRARFRTVEDFLALTRRDSLAFPPGSRWSYSNAGYMTLGAVIERVTGESYFDYVRRHVFERADMADAGFFALDEVVPRLAVGYTTSNSYNPGAKGRTPNTFLTTVKGSPAGGAYVTARDLLAFATALQGGRLLDAAHTRAMLAPTVPYGSGKKYGYGLAEEIVGGRRLLFHDGGAGGISAELDMLPELGYVVVTLSNYDPPAATRVARRAVALLAALGER